MGKQTAISWTDSTWNPWQGCRKVSPGCKNCYMFRDKKRFGQDPEKVVRSKPATFNAPLHWKEPKKVFVCSWSDFFIEDADPWRDDAWDIIRRTPHLTYQLLTKRPENIEYRLPDDWPLPNVWLGVTAENQEKAYERIPFILHDFPSVKTFVSIEPMLGPIDLGGCLIGSKKILRIPEIKPIDWVIVGGESGPNFREMKEEWATDIMNQCKDSDTPFFMKQISGVNPRKIPIPEHLNIKEFPK